MKRFCCFLILALCPVVSAEAKEAAFQSEEITFQSASEVSLSGSLVLPHTPGPHPAIVMLGGSERMNRKAIYVWANADSLVAQGIAVFSFDSPGTGKSTGSRWKRSVRERTEDALAAIKALQSRKDIRGDLVGLYGASEGGVVTFRAASRGKSIAFGIAISAPAVSDTQFIDGKIKLLCSVTGLEGEQLDKLVTFNILLADLIRGYRRADYGELKNVVAKWKEPNWNKLIAVLEKRENYTQDTQEAFIAVAQEWEGEEWFQKNKIVRQVQKQFVKTQGIDLTGLSFDASEQDSVKRHIRYGKAMLAILARSNTPMAMMATNDPSKDKDPVAFLKKIQCPMLCVYGEKDHEMSVFPGIVRKAFADAGHNDWVVKVFPGAGHQLKVTEGERTFRHPDFEKLVLDWVQQRVQVN